MTKSEFESMDFEEAMERLCEENNLITNYSTLASYTIQAIEEENIGLAVHILNAIYSTGYDSSNGHNDWYYYDYSMGTMCTPVSINNSVDVENLIGFDKELKQMNYSYLTEEQAIKLVGKELVDKCKEENCDWAMNDTFNQVEKWVGSVSFENENIYHGLQSVLMAVYYQPLHSTENVEDLGSLNWKIDHFEIA